MSYNNKNHLQKRTIQPSEDAWNKLDKRLTDFEKSKKKNYWPFLRYAAAVLIFVSVGIYFFGNKESQIEIVNQPVKKVEKHKIEPIIEETENVIATIKEESSKEIIKKEEFKNTINKKQENDRIASKTLNKQDKVYEKSDSDSKVVLDTQVLGVASLEDQKIQEVIDLVAHIKKEKGEVTDFEIEQLLSAAQKSLKVESKSLKNKSFSGADLLAEVEYDLDKDFKNRLFEAIVNTLKEPKYIFVARDN